METGCNGYDDSRGSVHVLLGVTIMRNVPIRTIATSYQERADSAIERFKRDARSLADDVYREVIAPYLEANGLRWIGSGYSAHGFRKANGETIDFISIAPEIRVLWAMTYTSDEWDCEGCASNYLRDLWPVSEDCDVG